MSKYTKNADMWRHVYAAAADRPSSWCKSCGYVPVVTGAHAPYCAIEFGEVKTK